MILNKTPVRTAINYGINDTQVEDSVFNVNVGKFSNAVIENLRLTNFQNKANSDIVSPISNELLEQSQKANYFLTATLEGHMEDATSIQFILDKEQNALVDVLNVVAKEGCKRTLVIRYDSSDKVYHNGVIKFICEKNSELKVYIVMDIGKESNNFLAVETGMDESAKLNVTIVDFASTNSIEGLYSKMYGNNAEQKIRVLYLGSGKSKIDLNYNVDVLGEDCDIDIDAVGAVGGVDEKNFRGTINLKKGAKRSNGAENEYCTLLSGKAHVRTLPILLCTEEDIKGGKHSSTVGKIEGNELFYIMSRGLDKKSAMKLVVKARFGSVLKNINDEKLVNEITTKIDERLDNED